MQQCLKGINWGDVAVDEKAVTVKYQNQQVIKIPLKKIQNSTTQKNDIVMQLNVDDADQNDDNLCEIRFYVPPSVQDVEVGKLKQERKKKEEGGENEYLTFQEKIQQEVLAKAKIEQATSESIVSLPELSLLVPRGKYSVDVFKKNLRFHGTTYQFSVDFKAISKLLLLPMPDDVTMLLVLALDKPMKQGLTAYAHLLLALKAHDAHPLHLKYSKQQLLDIGWANVDPSYDGPLHDSLCQILSQVTGIKVVIPKNFNSAHHKKSLRCSLGPTQGHLFPLEQSLIFIPKPVTHLRHTEVDQVVFERVGHHLSNKLFDMELKLKKGTARFNHIDRQELDPLLDYFQAKKIPVKQIQEDTTKMQFALPSDDDHDQIRKDKDDLNLDSDEDDEDFQVNEAANDDDDDAE